MHNNMQMNPHEYQGDYQPDQIKGLCRQYMNYHVIGQLSDGRQVDGIIDSMDEEGVTMLVPEEVDAEQMNRQFDYGYDYNYDYDDYGRPRRRRFRRFRRQRFPFHFFRRLFRFPYYSPPYPGYGYGGGYY